MIKQAPFKPTDIGGCKAWFDAYDASYTTTGNTVTAWTNKSGNANASTGAGTVNINQATLNGKSSVRFAAGTNYLNIGSISYSTSYRNQFFVVTVGASGSFYWYLNCNDTICGQCYSWNNSDIEINRSGLNGIVTNNPTGFFSSTSFVSICTSSGGNTGIWVNGSNQTLSVNNVGTGGFFSTGTATGITLGGQNGFTTGNLDMYELLQYDGDLTTPQRQQIESYLAQKWGLRQQLPQGHPGTQGIVYPSQPIPTAIYWRYQNIFLPTSINNLVLWLDAADTSSASMILSGSNVTTWKDKSGTGNNATANTGTVTTNSTQINGLNTIRFATSSFLNIASFAMTTNISVFAVLRGVAAQGTGPKGYFFLGNGAQPSFFVYTLPSQYGNISGPFSGWVASTGETNWYMPSSDYFLNNPGFIYTDNSTSYVNGSQLTFNPNRASVPNTVTAGTYSIQVGGRGAGDTIDFDFAECIFYNRTITTIERQQVEGYLAWKWGLQASLPANHPYKNSSPTTTNPAGISRPANVLPIPPITCTPVSKIRTLVTQIFSYTGSLQTYSVPAGVTSVVLYMWGAGGGTSQSVGGFVNYSGGAGAMVQGVYPVTPASTLYVVVGKGGVTNQSAQTDAQGGGGAANSAGGGGGRSAIQLTAGGADVVVAGGGGGGGLLYANNNGTGGPAYFSGSSPNTLAAVTGYGGTQTAGGAGGGNGGGAGSLKFGGAGTGPGGGGGGGYYGGGGMGNGDQGWDPGAGGSSLIDNLSLIPGESVFGFNSTNLSGAPNTTSPYYVSNVAAGGIGANATGGNGRVVVGYYL